MVAILVQYHDGRVVEIYCMCSVRQNVRESIFMCVIHEFGDADVGSEGFDFLLYLLLDLRSFVV